MSQGGQGHYSSSSSCGEGPLPEDLSGSQKTSGEHGWGLLTSAALILDTCCFCHAHGARRSRECGLPRLPRIQSFMASSQAPLRSSGLLGSTVG